MTAIDKLKVCCVLCPMCDFCLAVDVHVNRYLDNITAGGVQICGLHATVAPRRQQQQTPPTLEEFVFAPLVETNCLVSSEKLSEQLRHSKGKFLYSHISSMCFKSILYQV